MSTPAMARHPHHGASSIPKQFKPWSDIIATWVTIIGVFAGGAFALVQYFESQSSERVKQTLDFITRYNEGPLQEAQVKWEKFWTPKRIEIRERANAGESELSSFLDGAIRDNELEAEVCIFLSFFENLHACTCGNTCDQATVRRFFGKSAYDLWGLVAPYISEERQHRYDESYGLGLQAFAMDYRHKRSSNFKREYCSKKYVEGPEPPAIGSPA